MLKLTQPHLAAPIVVTCDSKDLPGKLFESQIKNDICTTAESETICASQFMLLPQSIRLV